MTKLRALSKPDWLRKVDPDLEALAEAQGFAFRAGPRPRIDDALLEQLRYAIVARKQVKVRHRKSPDDRAAWQTVGPLGFLYGSQHYLVAWSERRRQVVLFRLSRIDRVEVLDAAFDAPDDFDLDAYARRSFGVFQEEPVDVAWRFKPSVAAEARECVFHPDQVIEDQRDGSVVVRFRAGGLQEMAWYLLTWGRDVEVLAPAKLERELIKWSMQAIRQHGRGADGALELSTLGEARGVARGAAAKPASARARRRRARE
jgi:predicted DNA-binding transcriptional regulator YafY